MGISDEQIAQVQSLTPFITNIIINIIIIIIIIINITIINIIIILQLSIDLILNTKPSHSSWSQPLCVCQGLPLNVCFDGHQPTPTVKTCRAFFFFFVDADSADKYCRNSLFHVFAFRCRLLSRSDLLVLSDMSFSNGYDKGFVFFLFEIFLLAEISLLVVFTIVIAKIVSVRY